MSDPAGRIPVRRGSRSLGKFDRVLFNPLPSNGAFVIAGYLGRRWLILCYKNHQVPDLPVPGN